MSIDVDKANAKELRQYARDHHGINFGSKTGVEAMRKRIRLEMQNDDHDGRTAAVLVRAVEGNNVDGHIIYVTSKTPGKAEERHSVTVGVWQRVDPVVANYVVN